MPQRDRVTWAQLRVGILVIVAMTIFGLGVFFISGSVGFLGRHYIVKAFFSTAGGLREGAQVRLAGITVGNVDKLHISPYSEPNRAVEVDLKINQSFQNEVRADSVASMETAGLLGDAYIDISRGTPGQPVVSSGGEIKASEQAEIKQVVQNANDVILNLRALSAKLNEITGAVQSGQGTMGKFIYDPAVYNRVNATAERFDRLVAQVENGQGSIGKFMSDDTLYNRSVAAVDHLNQVIDDMQHGNGSIAKFMSDPSLYNNLNHVVTRADNMMASIESGQGTMGKLIKDPELYNRMNDTLNKMDVISTRIEKGEGTLGKLSTDPTMYNNLSSSSQSLKEFLTEFRKNPKKYLTIKVRFF